MIIKVNLAPSYEIEIEKGLVKNKSLPKGFVITDSNVNQKYGYLIKGEKIVVKPGEKSKRLCNYKSILEDISRKNVSKIIAFGGGVIGDLAGFVASTYNRGISLTHIPTTLLAMTDSSIGGKNGLNLGKIKNKIGTIYQPEKVLIDPLFLETLSDREFKNGVAEIIKYSYIHNSPNLKRLIQGINKNDNDLEDIIFQSCLIKAQVTEKDEFDKDYRHTLNFGHTIGHAIELLYNLRHGEAISIGMAKELELGSKIGMIKKEKVDGIEETLKANHLPTEFPPSIDINKVLNIMKHDKKGGLIFVFDKKNYNVKLDEEIVRDFLKNENPEQN